MPRQHRQRSQRHVIGERQPGRGEHLLEHPAHGEHGGAAVDQRPPTSSRRILPPGAAPAPGPAPPCRGGKRRAAESPPIPAPTMTMRSRVMGPRLLTVAEPPEYVNVPDIRKCPVLLTLGDSPMDIGHVSNGTGTGRVPRHRSRAPPLLCEALRYAVSRAARGSGHGSLCGGDCLRQRKPFRGHAAASQSSSCTAPRWSMTTCPASTIRRCGAASLRSMRPSASGSRCSPATR